MLERVELIGLIRPIWNGLGPVLEHGLGHAPFVILGVRFGCCSRSHKAAAGSTITVSMLSQSAIGGPVERVAEDDCEFYQGSVRRADSG